MAKQNAPGGSKTAQRQQARPRAGGTPQQLSRGQQRRRAAREVRRPWWRGPIPIIGTVVVVLIAIGVFIWLSNQSSSTGSGQIGQAAPAALVRQVTNVSASVIAAVGGGKQADGSALPVPYRAISGPPLTTNGKPQFLYIGGEFCPICAADRWSMVNALSRFGSFSNLHYMRSAVDDGDIATFTFRGSSYTSPYLSFLPIENEDRNRQPLQPLTSQQQQLLSTLGNNGYPFVDIAGKYANDAPNAWPGGYDESVLSGKSWSQIANALSDANDPITQGAIGNANYLTAAICKVTNNQPASACSTSTIRQLQQRL